MLTNKVVVITGGAGLIGKALIRGIVENNGIAILTDIDSTAGSKEKARLAIELSSPNIDFVKLDITSKDSLEACINYLHSRYEKIDALVNNAYPSNKNYGRHFFDVEYSDFVENVGLNLGGYFLASQQFASYFEKQGFGNIVNVASIYGVVAPTFEIYEGTAMTTPVEYAAIKSGLIHLTKYMANYFKGTNIRVNSLSPGGVFNNQPESFLRAYRNKCLHKGMLDATDLAGTLVYLISNMSAFVNGQNIIVDDGFTL